MDKPRDDVCGCCGPRPASPSLRLLIDMLAKAEEKRKAEEQRLQKAAVPPDGGG